ncbi:hypothetical protein [Intrasporangium calvum]|uniref:Uncharacterized protein n=1 Tax=Intrasporangium calvum (strain ATCC 23552 / DSM 43043 / JCM 3097 / NBRC 12989 / NCIMB 10167 / NRRL B-3866 / 7 KIP) TaxID=710696 RepID=E6S910_INTC7|nr:hypothetical protein [Intrasporangium calvum]ADU49185.1 hypothetical protein Intca_2683 [Intrasporangium calvum DSM 43043]
MSTTNSQTSPEYIRTGPLVDEAFELIREATRLARDGGTEEERCLFAFRKHELLERIGAAAAVEESKDRA